MNHPPSRTSPRSGTPDWAGRILAATLFIWIVGVTLGAHLAGYLADQIALVSGDAFPGWIWLFLAAGQSGAIAVPSTLLAWFWKRPRYRATFRLWAVAGLFPAMLAPIHLPGPLQATLATMLQILLALLFALLVWGWARWRSAPVPAGATGAVWLRPALALLLMLALPWLRWGALGSWLDVALSLLAGLVLGLAAAVTLEYFWLRPFFGTAQGTGSARDLFLGGFPAGLALLVIGGGYGYDGQQLWLLSLLSSLGWVVMALGRPAGNLRLLTLVVGGTAALPLLLLDPREMAAFLLLAEELQWVVRAVLLSLGIGWLAGALALLGRRLAGRRQRLLPRWGWSLAVVAALLAATAVYLGAGHPGFHGEKLFVVLEEQANLDQVPPGEVSLRRRYVYETLVAHADDTQADLRRSLDRLGIEYTPYYLVNGLAVDGGPLLHLWLETRPGVARVLPNPTLRPVDLGTGSDLLRRSVPAPDTLPWNLTRIGADRVWTELGVTGRGIVVGQSDSGVQWDHPELADGYRGEGGNHDYNWFDPWYGTDAPVDVGGHGTHTLGTVLGDTVGVAPGAAWYGCANLARTLGNTALYLDCLQFMLAPFPLGGDPLREGKPALGANVINNSWGCPDIEGCDPGVLQPAVDALRAAGTFVVVSAGNDGPGCASLDNPPAIYDAAFSVGASTPGDSLAPFSSRGPVVVDGSNRIKPDIVAPGTEIVSAFPTGGYRTWEGTSMAGPHVAGVVALMWSANPGLIGAIEETERILTETAEPLSTGVVCGSADGVPTNSYGFGLVDAYAAVEAALAWGE